MINHAGTQVLQKFPILSARSPLADWQHRAKPTDPEQAVIDFDRDGQAGAHDAVVTNFQQLKAYAQSEGTTILTQEDVKGQPCQVIDVDCEGGRHAKASNLDALADVAEPVRKSFWGINFQTNEWFIGCHTGEM